VTDRAVLPPAPPADGSPARDDPDDLTSLRAILLGPTEAEIKRLRMRLDDRYSQARDVSAVLPQALAQCSSDPELARALAPPVEKAITASVRRDPRPLADAIFPIIGPAIRKAVAASLAAMVESMNRSLEHSVSWRALRWRLEARRTGRTFGEVVLLHTLLYRIEQVFLIHRKTGLLLQHVRAHSADVADAQMVSAMLTAIRDFAQDSFRTAAQDSLEAFEVGELSVWIEQGPDAVIAAVIRGNAPKAYRRTLQDAVERVHLQFGEPLATFDGDAKAFEAARPILEECLHSEFRTGDAPRSRLLPILAALILIALAIWGVLAWRQQSRWSHYLAALRQEPGIIVISSGRSAGQYRVSGLRDPLARDPVTLLTESDLTAADVAGVWEPYQALGKRFVVARASRILRPPAGMTLDLHDDVLSAAGSAPPAWIADAVRLAPLIPGVSRFDATALLRAQLDAVVRQIEGVTVLFARGTTQLAADGDAQLRMLAAAVRDLERLAASLGRTAQLEIVGHTDGDGDPASNLPLSRARAERVLQALEPGAMLHLTITPGGVGSDHPLRRGDAEADKQQNRRVTVRVAAGSPPPERSPGR
jgi:outer membrane protein OmpA-like peptidoglycan-associated protein